MSAHRYTLWSSVFLLLSFPAIAIALGDHMNATQIQRRILSHLDARRRGRKLIVGGSDALPDRFPYYTILDVETPSGFFFCGSVLIHSDILLTTAGCLRNATSIFAAVNFTIETPEPNPGTFFREIISYRTHENYVSSTINNNIAVLKMDLPVPIAPVVLSPNRPNDGVSVTVVGFGKLSPGTELFPTVLQEVAVDIISSELCNTLYEGVREIEDSQMICARAEGKDACSGDGGGPFVLKGEAVSDDRLVGLVSWGIGCAIFDRPGVYTRVQTYLNWIETGICDLSDFSPSSCSSSQPAPSEAPTTTTTSSPSSKPSTTFLGVGVTIEIHLDSFPAQTAWQILSGSQILHEVPFGFYTTAGPAVETVTLEVGRSYQFVLLDQGNDGISGVTEAVRVLISDRVLLSLPAGFSNSITGFFTVPFPSNNAPAPNPTASPSIVPTHAPTSAPSAQPTMLPDTRRCRITSSDTRRLVKGANIASDHRLLRKSDELPRAKFPHLRPTASPSSSPSSSNSPSNMPSLHPSLSVRPSLVPSVTIEPTSKAVSDEVTSTILSVALRGGAEFNDPTTPQSMALDFVIRFVDSMMTSLRKLQDIDVPAYYALACIYFSSYAVSNRHKMDDLMGWVNANGWVSFGDKCTWFGVACDSNGAVVGIEMPDNNMLGTIAAEIQILSALETVVFSDNCFLTTTGLDWVGTMSNLKTFLVDGTQVGAGGFPLFSNQSLLELVDISYSNFRLGPIRKESFRGLVNLRGLAMNDNAYTTPFPTDIDALPSLTDFSLSNAGLLGGRGQDLSFLGTKMLALTDLQMSNVLLLTSIPTEIGRLTGLTSLNLSGGALVGPIPTEIGRLTALQVLNLNSNFLTGTIPLEIASLTRLQVLDLGSNRLVGSIPTTSLVVLTGLSLLNVADNVRLSGDLSTLCSSVLNVTNLVALADCPTPVDCPCCQGC